MFWLVRNVDGISYYFSQLNKLITSVQTQKSWMRMWTHLQYSINSTVRGEVSITDNKYPSDTNLCRSTRGRSRSDAATSSLGSSTIVMQ